MHNLGMLVLVLVLLVMESRTQASRPKPRPRTSKLSSSILENEDLSSRTPTLCPC